MSARLKVLIVAASAIVSFTATAYAVAQHRVDQSALQFSEQSVRLRRGDTIVFSNSDRTSHNVTIAGGSMNFNGGLQRPGQDIEVPFTAAGTYQVTCGIHPRMALTVQVE